MTFLKPGPPSGRIKNRPPVRAAVLFGVTLVMAGCADVSPWERGYLAKPHMALEPDPAQAVLRVHAYRSREAAAGWGEATGAGAGCGCY